MTPVKLKKTNPDSRFRDEFTRAIIERCAAADPYKVTPHQVAFVTDAIRSELNERIADAYREIEVGGQKTVWSIPNILAIEVKTRKVGMHGNATMPVTKLRLQNTYRQKLRDAGLSRNMDED